MTEIDARGKACPAPVLMTRDAILDKPGETVHVIVDNEAAKQNVTRFLESRGYTAEAREQGPDFCVRGFSADAPQAAKEPAESGHKTEEPATERKIMVMVCTDRMGYGDDVLGRKLMANFIKTLEEMGPELWRLVLVNNGVKLAISGSETLEDLKKLEREGIVLLVCGTCLDHFGLLKQKQVGVTTNMLDIVTAMQLADKVINI
ncbi:MAG: sulfurtransferase-like selenium metabolism protein YedF [Desulfosalsimonadaceae bacterium]